jgi:hypothetical protein
MYDICPNWHEKPTQASHFLRIAERLDLPYRGEDAARACDAEDVRLIIGGNGPNGRHALAFAVEFTYQSMIAQDRTSR